ncbi:hypothetical protein BOX09_gp43 [Flavobacterium phage Fpv1]|uniref:Uncharacterized protein n=2 Tax=Fipvunavirus Fpv1 TaxID=2560475 RepID=A0A1B0WM20_9CAUD|nr:hypothetical protein BOW81_gp43 [Flavobacterium phage Fpv20]YP_009322045.1 hypothetical protein BOX09_gp43 [Flavobacterium phage Fpv1]YP_009323634.1 hypothetical protein BOW82_gp43 [Flavobacterium phage Fpv2]QCW20300.1 hypothetical protein [Flavobacterium phage FPSV-F12]ANB40285.1 hypothetical protein [Flavobacterium phage Fpv1]ANB40365.1 hypothetical protein [Flavobacterium phage Fpv2]ANB40872.1 hypothetical protein [Flavobacterium phage Fpv20]
MKAEFIKNGQVIFETFEGRMTDEIEKKMIEFTETETVKSMEITLKEGSTLRDLNDLLVEGKTDCLILQKIYFND